MEISCLWVLIFKLQQNKLLDIPLKIYNVNDYGENNSISLVLCPDFRNQKTKQI